MAESRTWRPVETRDPEVLEQVYRLRVEAWRARNAMFPEMDRWTDEYDTVGRHWVVLEDGRPIAAARLTVHDALADAPSAEIYRRISPDELPGLIGVLTRLVVEPGHGGRGLSRALDIARIDAARAAGCRSLIGETFEGLPRLGELKRLGFEQIGRADAYQFGPLAPVKSADGAPARAIIRLRLTAD